MPARLALQRRRPRPARSGAPRTWPPGRALAGSARCPRRRSESRGSSRSWPTCRPDRRMRSPRPPGRRGPPRPRTGRRRARPARRRRRRRRTAAAASPAEPRPIARPSSALLGLRRISPSPGDHHGGLVGLDREAAEQRIRILVILEIDPLVGHAVARQELAQAPGVRGEPRADQLDPGSDVDQDRAPGHECAEDQVAHCLVLSDELAAASSRGSGSPRRDPGRPPRDRAVGR